MQKKSDKEENWQETEQNLAMLQQIGGGRRFIEMREFRQFFKRVGVDLTAIQALNVKSLEVGRLNQTLLANYSKLQTKCYLKGIRFPLPRRLNYLLKQSIFLNERLTYQESIDRNSSIEDKCNNIRSLLGTSLSFKNKYASNKSSLKTSFINERPEEFVDHQKRFVQTLMKFPEALEVKEKPPVSVLPAFAIEKQNYKSKLIIRSLPKTISLPACTKRVQLRVGQSLEPSKLWLKRMEQLKNRNRELLQHAFTNYGLFQQREQPQSQLDLDEIQKDIKDQSTTHFKDSSSIPDLFIEELIASSAKEERPENLRLLELTGQERPQKASVYRMNRTCKSVKKAQKVVRAALQIQGKGI